MTMDLPIVLLAQLQAGISIHGACKKESIMKSSSHSHGVKLGEDGLLLLLLLVWTRALKLQRKLHIFYLLTENKATTVFCISTNSVGWVKTCISFFSGLLRIYHTLLSNYTNWKIQTRTLVTYSYLLTCMRTEVSTQGWKKVDVK